MECLFPLFSVSLVVVVSLCVLVFLSAIVSLCDCVSLPGSLCGEEEEVLWPHDEGSPYISVFVVVRVRVRPLESGLNYYHRLATASRTDSS